MIGCLIAGGLAVFAFSRMMHHRRLCAGGWGGWRSGCASDRHQILH